VLRSVWCINKHLCHPLHRQAKLDGRAASFHNQDRCTRLWQAKLPLAVHTGCVCTPRVMPSVERRRAAWSASPGHLVRMSGCAMAPQHRSSSAVRSGLRRTDGGYSDRYAAAVSPARSCCSSSSFATASTRNPVIPPHRLSSCTPPLSTENACVAAVACTARVACANQFLRADHFVRCQPSR